MTMQAYDLAYKLCVIGDAGVGKTCIIQRFAVSAHAHYVHVLHRSHVA